LGDEGRIRQALVVGLDLADGVPARGTWVEDLVQKGEEGELGSIDPFPAVGPRGIGVEQGGVDPIAADVLEVVKGARALEGLGGVLE